MYTNATALLTPIIISQMSASSNLPYKTEQLEMTTVLFESMINNLGSRIRRMNLQLHFKTENEKAAFVNALQRQKEREENEVELEDSDEDIQQEADKDKERSIFLKKEPVAEMDSIVIEETFEKSILLREKFMDQLKSIGQRLKVKFMVVPNKVKIRGPIRDRVDDAQDEYREIQQNICFEPIDKYGKEIYQSKFFKNYLKEYKVEVIQILRKFYFWFLRNDAQPMDAIQEVFYNTKHALYPLHRMRHNEREAIASGRGAVVLGDIEFNKTKERITDKLFVCIRARIFQVAISKKLNQMEDRKARQIELSEDRRGLVLHMDVEEQLEIQSKSIEQEYNKYKCLFFMFNEEMEMSKVSDFMHKLNLSFIICEILENYLCLSFSAHRPVTTQEEIAKHPLMLIVSQMPQELLNFKLGIFDVIDIPEDKQWSFLTIDRDSVEKITTVGVKTMMTRNYQKLIKLYIQNKLSPEYLAKAKEQKQSILNASKVPDISIDMSRPVDESTQHIMNDFDRTNRNEKEVEAKSEIGKEILGGEGMEDINFRYENYKILISQSAEEREKKFSEDVSKIERGKLPTKFEDCEKTMLATTTFRYKVYRVKVPSKFNLDLQLEVEKVLAEHPEWSHLNQWVTVFAGGKDIKQLEGLYEPDKKVKITKIEKNYKMKEGYLLTTNALFLYEESEELPLGRYEAMFFIRKIE